MKVKFVIFTATIFFMVTHTFGQTTQFRYRVWIQKKHKVIQDVKTEKADTVNLRAGTIISSQKKYKIDDIEYTADIKDTIKTDTKIFATKDIPRNQTLPGWATLAVDKDDKSKVNINYWLGEQYDRNGKYYLKLKNRQYASFWFNCVEGGALTIPFKYRAKFTKNNIDIPSDFTADLNIGAYLGYSFGKVKYMYRKNEDKEPSKWLVSIGPFLSVSRVEIDSTSTPIKEMENTAVSLEKLFGREGKDIEEKILNAHSVQERINLIEIFLLNRLERVDAINNIVRILKSYNIQVTIN